MVKDFSNAWENLLCVVCNNNLGKPADPKSDSVKCGSCGQSYPVIQGIPVVIDEAKSIFRFSDFLDSRNLFFDISKKGKIVGALKKFVPSIGGNNLGRKNFTFLEELLVREKGNGARVLVVGGSIVGDGMDKFVESKQLWFVESDVSFGPRTQIIFDGHAIPYRDGSFDCVIVQAVLEHVLDPIQCVKEIHRVLSPGGVVYAETPFMQQVHGGPYDFTRFSRSGHRRLFRNFTEVKAGMTAGTGTSLAWSYQYFLLALFGHGNALRSVVKAFARFTGFWMKYLDYITGLNKRESDSASGFYFIGKRSETSIPDQEIIKYYSRGN